MRYGMVYFDIFYCAAHYVAAADGGNVAVAALSMWNLWKLQFLRNLCVYLGIIFLWGIKLKKKKTNADWENEFHFNPADRETDRPTKKQTMPTTKPNSMLSIMAIIH